MKPFKRGKVWYVQFTWRENPLGNKRSTTRKLVQGLTPAINKSQATTWMSDSIEAYKRKCMQKDESEKLEIADPQLLDVYEQYIKVNGERMSERTKNLGLQSMEMFADHFPTLSSINDTTLAKN